MSPTSGWRRRQNFQASTSKQEQPLIGCALSATKKGLWTRPKIKYSQLHTPSLRSCIGNIVEEAEIKPKAKDIKKANDVQTCPQDL